MSVKKSSVSFNSSIWKRLSQSKNKSKVVNEALRLYFMLESMQAKEECAYSEKEIAFLKSEWKHYKETGESWSYEDTFNRSL